MKNDAVEQAAENYVDAREWPRKGDSRESYDTLMRYEVRDYLIEAHEDGQQVGVAWALKGHPDVLNLVACCERQMLSDEACGHPFNEDMAAAMARFEKAGK